MRFTENFRVPSAPAAVLDYAADFRNLPQWDPSVIAAEKCTPGPIGVGSRFLVTLKFLGFDSTMDYVVEVWEPGRRARLRGETPVATAIDTITVEEAGEKTSVTWDADIQFVFPLSLLDSLFAAGFRPTAMAAVSGLRRVLKNLQAAPRSEPA